jgi:dipeptide/tripeptide permease
MFQSLNGVCYYFAAIVASYWAKRKLKVEASSIFKMAIVIMGFGFFVYGFATMEFEKSRIFKYVMVGYGLFVSPLENYVFP